MNPLSLEHKVILVTGASSGLGRACCVLFGRLGARVALAGRDLNRLESALAEMEGANHSVHPFDLRETDAVPEWVRAVSRQTGPIYGLVHSAGSHIMKPLRASASSDLDEIMRLNVTAAMMLAKGLRVPGVSERPASLVFLSSVAGRTGAAGNSIYAASKAALEGLARSLAIELARDQIRVNCIAPGVVESEMANQMRSKLGDDQFAAIVDAHPLGIGQPADVANAAAFLVSETGRWITGSTLVVDGGFSAQ